MAMEASSSCSTLFFHGHEQSKETFKPKTLPLRKRF
uniref:Uncharacterized protein n=1 Tax=Tetranychus urticae TaxID=32264 RepID=T1JQJ0_TETUR